MHFKHIRLINFKNFDDSQFSFEGDLIAITGPNGSGKTNLIDAIHFCCLSKSYFNGSDKYLCRHEQDFYSVKATYSNEGEDNELFLRQKTGERKKIRHNAQEYERVSDHLGNIPVVMIAPADTDIIRGGSELRRRFLDMLLSQSDKQYLSSLQKYNGLLRNKAATLKSIRLGGYRDQQLLDVYLEQMTPLINYISKVRLSFVEQANTEIASLYERIAGNAENAKIRLLSDLNGENAYDVLMASGQAELQNGRCLVGPQKDDLQFLLDERAIKNYGSQGQQKSFLISLKLLQFNYLLDMLLKCPVLLLDDIFEKLDSDRLKNLLQMVTEPPFEQIFITDTSSERVRSYFSQHQLCEIEL